MAASQSRAADGDWAVAVSVRLLKTPIGTLQLVASDAGLLSVELPSRRRERGVERWLRERLDRRQETPILHDVVAQLREYFSGTRHDFHLPVDPAGTEFQRRVWQQLAQIPYGETVSYGGVAEALGSSQLARTVAVAIRANPVRIVIPCHRVVGANGSLAGYAGGLRRKIWLLRHEGVLLT